QLLDSGVDVLLGGGLRHFLPHSASNRSSSQFRRVAAQVGAAVEFDSKRDDEENLLEVAQSRHYRLTFDRQGLAEASGTKVLGLFATSGLPNAIRENASRNAADRRIPTLQEMTEAALRLLSENPNGFVLMVEAGQIDWAGHQNDAGLLLHEMQRLDSALGAIANFVRNRSDTLVVITADHETGGFGLSYSGSQLPSPQQLSGDVFEDTLFAPQYNYGTPALLHALYAQKSSLVDIVHRFESLPEKEQSPERLQALIAEQTSFSLSAEEARRVLELEPNRYYVSEHSTLGERWVPRFGWQAAFYPNAPDEMRAALVARMLAPKQGIVWASGTHTSSPVFSIAWGPQEITKRYDGMRTAAELGTLLQQSLAL
ncbi:MAG: alkaline phosphatase, partial [Bdellovibrionales bacterium]|nr:alkaline phosphatase [Bdellovibrionales bacterium]